MNLTLVAKSLVTPAVTMYLLELFVLHVPLPTTRFSTGLLSNTASVAYDFICGFMDLLTGVLGIRATYLILWAPRLIRVGVDGYSSSALEPIASLLDIQIGFQIFSVAIVTYKKPTLGDKEHILLTAAILAAVLIARNLCLPPLYVAAFCGSQIVGFSYWLQRFVVRVGFTPTNVVGLFVNGLVVSSHFIFRGIWLIYFLLHSIKHIFDVSNALGWFGSLIIFYIPFLVLTVYQITWLVFTVKKMQNWYKLEKGKLRFNRIPSRGNLFRGLADVSGSQSKGRGSSRDDNFKVIGTQDPGYVSEGWEDIRHPTAHPRKGSGATLPSNPPVRKQTTAKNTVDPKETKKTK